ncbi:MAG: alcohol dehydrogenase catalytic domain-containing protein [Alphaproteobacteria bacterium]|jgi:Zn-dependent alcohol dehydrogenase|nr:alcohol dehydrogenase catalytic domain-containing protein [Alphaproteobacteria bacterium]MDP6517281.1 alcohol dehydrogenase catalytic domain-containing protein [Alphaproteobacteria bacterium]
MPDHHLRARAAVAVERGKPLQVREISVRAPGSDEVVVRVVVCGICASDVHVWRTGEGISFPAVLGHEAAGVIEAVGDNVRGVGPGSRVLVTWVAQCGTCRACRSGRPQLCAAISTDGVDGSLTLDGEPLARYMSVAGLAERIVVPARRVLPVPDTIALDEACLVGCGVTTGFGAAVISGQAQWGDSVAVFGCGAVGLSAIQGARVAGAGRIIAVDTNRQRLEAAGRLGATELLCPDDGEPSEAILQLSDGGVDLAVEAVGSPLVARQAFEAIAPGGRAVVVGLTSYRDEIKVPVVSLLLDRTLRGSIHGSANPARDIPRLFELMEGGQLRLAELSGPRFSLEQATDALAALEAGEAIRPRVTLQAE